MMLSRYQTEPMGVACRARAPLRLVLMLSRYEIEPMAAARAPGARLPLDL